MTREVMAEIGIPLDSHRSKGTHEYLGRVSIRHAVIVCEKLESQCPTIYPFAIQTHYWPFEDPASTVGDESQQRDAFRNVRDQIEAKIRDWINSGEVK